MQEAINTPDIERNLPTGSRHDLAQQHQLDQVDSMMLGKQDIVDLATYLKEVAGKPRGTKGGNADLNSHFEEYIIKKDGEIIVITLLDLQSELAQAGVTIELLGVQSIGNANQKVTSQVQGVNKDNPQSGYERPTVAEGPHMILAPYAVDNE